MYPVQRVGVGQCLVLGVDMRISGSPGGQMSLRRNMQRAGRLPGFCHDELAVMMSWLIGEVE